MNDNSLPHAGIDDLVSQDPAVSSFAYEEFRKKLEASIQQLEHRARIIRRASYWGLGIVIGGMLLPLPAEMFGLSKHEWLWSVLGGCWSVVVLITGVLAYIYRHRYKPALYRARSDLQSTMLAQLQQQVADLSRKLEHRS